MDGPLVDWDELPADISADDDFEVADSMGGGSFDGLPSSSGSPSGGAAGASDGGAAGPSKKKQKKEGAEKKRRQKRRILPSAEVCAWARYAVAAVIGRPLARSHSPC